MSPSPEGAGPGAKLLVIGLDCAAPALVFGRLKDELPNLRRLAAEGVHGTLESCCPPITVLAWMCMMTGRDPGELGIYGFRNRKDRSYAGHAFANARWVREQTAFDALSAAGKRVIVLSVPCTYPPRPVNGVMVSCFLTPGPQSDFTYPKELKAEVQEVTGGYMIDVPNFRTDDRERLLGDLHEMLRRRWKLFRHLLATRPWDFAMAVEMGTDRIHHGFWHFMDPEHPRYEGPGSKFEHAIRDYYRAVDREIGETLRVAGDDTTVLVVSDHGARPLFGGVNLNEWLIREGLLALVRQPEKPCPIEKAEVDWARTKVWGYGGYYGRVYLNVAGREPQGTIPGAELEPFRDALAKKVEAMTGPDGKPLGNRCFKPEQVYRTVKNIAPDLFIYFGDLAWRSQGTVGTGALFTDGNDTGPDEANHDREGIYILRDPAGSFGPPRWEPRRIFDIAPTILKRFGVAAPAGMGGRAI